MNKNEKLGTNKIKSNNEERRSEMDTIETERNL